MAGIPHDHYKPKTGISVSCALADSWFNVCNIDCTDPEEPELDVDLGHCSYVLSGIANRYRSCPSNALHPTR